MNETNPVATQNEEEEEVELIDPSTLVTDLYVAASQNNTEQVLKFLEMNVPPTYYDAKTGLTALHWAAMNGNVVMVKSLLQYGASQPYHAYVQKLRKQAQSKQMRKMRQMDSKLTSISEVVEGEEGPIDETKETAEAEKDLDDLDAEESLAIDMNALTSDTTIEYTKNTPLLFATHGGHLRVVWLLLSDGYSPSDVDKMMNNALHLAAAFGDVKILQVLINDGGNANAVNYYKNKPIDMAKNKAVRDLLVVAMEAGASLTDEDRRVKHEQNIRQYLQMTRSLEEAIAEAMASRNTSPRGAMLTTTSRRVNRILQDAIEMGKEYSLDESLIDEASLLLKKIEASQDLTDDIAAVQAIAPIKSQATYIEYIYKLEKSIERAIEVKVEEQQIAFGMELIAKIQAEYWLQVLLERLKDVTTANDTNEHDMNKLRKALERAIALQVEESLIERAQKFLGRLDAELGLYRALRAIPTFKPIIDNPPEGYWTERDTGKLEENEGFPLPPPETGEYVWIQSEALTAFSAAVGRLREIYHSPDVANANPKIVAEAKDRLTKAEKELKQLEAKEESDKNGAIEAAKKAAKKLKKKKK